MFCKELMSEFLVSTTKIKGDFQLWEHKSNNLKDYFIVKDTNCIFYFK